MCLHCDLHKEHGGRVANKLYALNFFMLDMPVVLGYSRAWIDEHGKVWWTAVRGPEGEMPAPLTERAQAFRTVRNGAVMPLFDTRDDAVHAIRQACGLTDGPVMQV